MTRDNGQGNTRVQLDQFRAGRVAALQPAMDRAVLSQPMMQTTDPMIINNVTNIVRMWAHERQDVPSDFCDYVTIQSVSRQPVAFVVVEAEHVARQITPNDTPFSGDTYDAQEWQTNDVFELAPLADLAFPAAETLTEWPLRGQEEVRQCGDCSGAGQHACADCDATGQITCPTCGGTLQVVCPTCEGAGTHIGVRGNYIQCQSCRTRGYVRCTRCNRGNLACDHCASTGQIQCSTCLGHGNLLRSWTLVTRTSSWRGREPYMPVDWQLPIDSLLDDCQEVGRSEWNGGVRPDLDSVLPGHLIPLAQRQVESILQRSQSLDVRTERMTGIRVRLLAAYVYKVECDYDGQTEPLFIGGLHSRAFTHRGLDRKSTIRGLMRSLSRRFARPFDKPIVDQAYLVDVRGGAVHISDTRRIVPEACSRAQARLELSENGYALKVPAESGSSEAATMVDIDVGWDVDEAGCLVICTTSIIGHAKRREMFVKLLGWNQQLSFGRLAFLQDPIAAPVQIALVDRRVYETIKALDYGRILSAMAAEAHQLQKYDAFR